MKPRLPPALEVRFPSTVLHVLYSYVPTESSKSKTSSPQLKKDLLRIQNAKLRGKNEMYLYNLDDFVLER